MYRAKIISAKQVHEHAQVMFQKVEDLHLHESAQDAWKILCADPLPESLYQTFGLQSEWNRSVFFGHLEIDDILSGIHEMSNSVKGALSEMILARYTKSHYPQIEEIFDDERDTLNAVRASLQSEIDSSTSPYPLSLLMKRKIVAAINAAHDKFSPPTPQPAQ